MYKPYYQPIYIPFLLNEEQSLTKRIRQVCLFFARTERNREFLLSRFFQSILMFDERGEEEYYFDANSNTFNLLRFCYPISFLSKPIIGNILFFINISKDKRFETNRRTRTRRNPVAKFTLAFLPSDINQSPFRPRSETRYKFLNSVN